MSTLGRPDPVDRPSGLLPKDPPARAIRWAGWLLLALAIAIATFSVSFRLPETVLAPVLLVPTEGADPLQAPLAGALAAVHVQAGQTVHAGQTLFHIRNDDIRNARARLRQLTEAERALHDRIRKLDESHQAELAIKDAELAQAERELGFRDQHLTTARDLLQRAQRLANDGLISEIELLNHQLAAAESEKDRVLTEKLRQQIALQRQDRVTARARARTDEQAEGENLRTQIAALREQLAETQDDLRLVRAPYDAVVLSVEQRTPGSMAAAGTELCQLARINARPRARLTLPESGLPQLTLGQPARLFLTAFPYQRHGAIPADIAWISPAAIHTPEGPRFLALADLRTNAPHALPLRVGMSGQARILVGRRTLAARVLDPLRALRERTLVPE